MVREDLLDIFASTYRAKVKGKEWGGPFFVNFLDGAKVNAWRQNILSVNLQ